MRQMRRREGDSFGPRCNATHSPNPRSCMQTQTDNTLMALTGLDPNREAHQRRSEHKQTRSRQPQRRNRLWSECRTLENMCCKQYASVNTYTNTHTRTNKGTHTHAVEPYSSDPVQVTRPSMSTAQSNASDMPMLTASDCIDAGTGTSESLWKIDRKNS